MSADRKRLEQLRSKVSSDPGCDELIELVTALSDDSKTRPEARDLCQRGLAENPHNHVVRLTLARLYYTDKLGEFCVRELFELKRRAGASLPSLEKLLEAFGDYATQFASTGFAQLPESSGRAAESPLQSPMIAGSKVVAELDLDADFTDLLEDLDDDGSAH